MDLLHISPRYATNRYDGDGLSVIHKANSAEGTPSQMTARTSPSAVVEHQPSIREVSVVVLGCNLKLITSSLVGLRAISKGG